MNESQMRHIGAADSGGRSPSREPSERPWIRIILNERQVPLILGAIRREEFAFRQLMRRLDVESPEAMGHAGATREQLEEAIRAQMKLLRMTRTMVIAEARAKGWYE